VGRGSADADRRHQIMITMMYSEEKKTDARDNDCGGCTIANG